MQLPSTLQGKLWNAGHVFPAGISCKVVNAPHPSSWFIPASSLFQSAVLTSNTTWGSSRWICTLIAWGLQIRIGRSNINRDVLSRQRYFCDCLYFCKSNLEMWSWGSDDRRFKSSGQTGHWIPKCLEPVYNFAAEIRQVSRKILVSLTWHVSWVSVEKGFSVLLFTNESTKLGLSSSASCHQQRVALRVVGWSGVPCSRKRGKYPQTSPSINTGPLWDQLFSHWSQPELWPRWVFI